MVVSFYAHISIAQQQLPTPICCSADWMEELEKGIHEQLDQHQFGSVGQCVFDQKRKVDTASELLDQALVLNNKEKEILGQKKSLGLKI